MKPIHLALVMLLAIAACGRGDIEDTQRSWLEEQHRLEKKLLEVRNDHIALRRRVDPARVALVADDASLDRFNRADAILREHEGKLNAMDTMIDRHSLARDNAIRADDAAAVGTGWSAATVDYNAAMAALEAIDNQQNEMVKALDDIKYREVAENDGGLDTLGSNRDVHDRTGSDDDNRVDRSSDGSDGRDDDKTIDNTIGRDIPDEPGR